MTSNSKVFRITFYPEHMLDTMDWGAHLESIGPCWEQGAKSLARPIHVGALVFSSLGSWTWAVYICNLGFRFTLTLRFMFAACLNCPTGWALCIPSVECCIASLLITTKAVIKPCKRTWNLNLATPCTCRWGFTGDASTVPPGLRLFVKALDEKVINAMQVKDVLESC